MPKDIVAQYAFLYTKYFEPATRRLLPNGRIKIPCYEGTRGFPGSYVIVNFTGQPHEKILAANCVALDEQPDDSVYHGSIQINPILKNESPELIKMVLAEEWLEVMMGLRDKKQGHMQKLVDNKMDLILLFTSLKRRCLWQDSTEQHTALHSALRELLVSEQMLRETASRCAYPLDDIPARISVSPDAATSELDKLVKIFSSEYRVDQDLVYDRLMAVLGF